MLDLVSHGVRLSLRSLWNRKAFTLAASLTLALGLGATAALFTVADSLLLRPLPFEEPDELVLVWQNDRLTGTTREAASVPDFLDLRQSARSLQGLSGFASGSMNLSRTDTDPLRLDALAVSHDFGSLLGINPLRGRHFLEEEDRPGAAAVAMLSESLWQRLGGDLEVPDLGIRGTQIQLDGEPYTVVGVLPAGLSFPAEADLWVPLQEDASTSQRSRHGLQLVGRLAEEATVGQAHKEIAALSAQLEELYPESNTGRGSLVESLSEYLRGPVRPTLIALLGAVAFVLAIACANVANLFLVHFSRRRRELAICTALGAGRLRLAVVFGAEGLLIAGLALVAAALIAQSTLKGLLRMAPSELAAIEGLSLDQRALGVLLALATVLGLVSAVVGIGQARVLNLASSLRAVGRAGGGAERSR